MHSYCRMQGEECHFSVHPAMFCTSRGQRRAATAFPAQAENFSQQNPPAFWRQTGGNRSGLTAVG